MTKLILSGYGGQGMLLCGQLLAYASMLGGKQVTWFPTYGAEVRGGAANCSVVIADRAVGSPVIGVTDILVACSQPSLDKFHPVVDDAGLVIYHSAIVQNVPERSGVRYMGVDFTALAHSIDFPRSANMVVLGVLAEIVGAKRENVSRALMYRFGSMPANVIATNEKAIDLGIAEAKAVVLI